MVANDRVGGPVVGAQPRVVASQGVDARPLPRLRIGRDVEGGADREAGLAVGRDAQAQARGAPPPRLAACQQHGPARAAHQRDLDRPVPMHQRRHVEPLPPPRAAAILPTAGSTTDGLLRHVTRRSDQSPGPVGRASTSSRARPMTYTHSEALRTTRPRTPLTRKRR